MHRVTIRRKFSQQTTLCQAPDHFDHLRSNRDAYLRQHTGTVAEQIRSILRSGDRGLLVMALQQSRHGPCPLRQGSISILYQSRLQYQATIDGLQERVITLLKMAHLRRGQSNLQHSGL